MTAAGRQGGGAGLAALAVLLLATGQPLAAQSAAEGRVVRPGAADTVPLAGVRVVLHRVGTAAQGPIDSVLTAAGGRFRFRYTPDSGAVYLLSARYHGIEYFSQPLGIDSARADGPISLLVHDTSSTAAVELAARHVVIPRPGEGGEREVIDFVVLRNSGHLTRVAPDSAAPSWVMPLPPGSEGLDLGQSDVSTEAVTREGDSLYLAAPIGPGEKQLALQYHLPAGMAVVAVPIGVAGGPVNVLVEERGARVSGPGLAPADTQLVLGRTFRRWSGEIPAGGLIRVQLPGPGQAPPWLLAALVGGVVLALAAAAWRVRGTATAGRTAPGFALPGEPLLDRIARLDAAYAGREADTPAAEWQGYLEERARLKAELEAALAAGRGRG